MLYDFVHLLRKPVCYPTRSRQFGAGMLEVACRSLSITYVLGK